MRAPICMIILLYDPLIVRRRGPKVYQLMGNYWLRRVFYGWTDRAYSVGVMPVMVLKAREKPWMLG